MIISCIKLDHTLRCTMVVQNVDHITITAFAAIIIITMIYMCSAHDIIFCTGEPSGEANKLELPYSSGCI